MDQTERSAYTVAETAAYWAARVERLKGKPTDRESLRGRITLDSVQAFLEHIASNELGHFAAPSTLPAETREGRRDAIAEVLFQHDLGIDTCECACGGWDADSSEETFEQHQADALLAASPAVSLPGEEKKP